MRIDLTKDEAWTLYLMAEARVTQDKCLGIDPEPSLALMRKLADAVSVDIEETQRRLERKRHASKTS